MAKSFTQIYVHVVFAVKRRLPLIHPSWEDELFRYITGIVQNKSETILEINGMPDHVHLLILLSGGTPLSDLVREIKKSTNTFIRERGFVSTPFQWQEGYGAFSCGQSGIEPLRRYIQNQKEHHRNKAFLDELRVFLKLYNVDYQEEWLETI